MYVTQAKLCLWTQKVKLDSVGQESFFNSYFQETKSHRCLEGTKSDQITHCSTITKFSICHKRMLYLFLFQLEALKILQKIHD